MPSLARIVVFPIKSLDGVELARGEVTPEGALAWDRRFALVDAQGKLINGKRTAAVHRLRARFDLPGGTVSLCAPGGAWHEFRLAPGQQELEEFLSRFFGQPVRLIENPQGGFPDDRNAPGPTLVSTASLEEVGRWFALELDQVRRRFRANLEVADTPPWWEDRLVAKSQDQAERFAIGSVVFQATGVCQRCVVPSRDPETGLPIERFAARFAQARKDHLPPWSPRSRFDHFYRLAVNTRLVSAPGALELGQQVRFPA